jgi:hypothetical protein
MGNRLKQQNVDAETGEVISRDDTVRGYEVAKGQYMIAQLSYSSWRRHQMPGSLRPFGARSSHWYMPQRPSSPRA